MQARMLEVLTVHKITSVHCTLAVFLALHLLKFLWIFVDGMIFIKAGSCCCSVLEIIRLFELGIQVL